MAAVAAAVVVAVALVVAMAMAMVVLRRVVVAAARVAAVVEMVVEDMARILSNVSVASECGRLMLKTVLGFWACLLRRTAHCGRQTVLLRGHLRLPSCRATKRL